MDGGGLHHLIYDCILGIYAKMGFQFLICRDMGTGTDGTAEVNGNTVWLLVAQCPDNSFAVT